MLRAFQEITGGLRYVLDNLRGIQWCFMEFKSFRVSHGVLEAFQKVLWGVSGSFGRSLGRFQGI